MQVVLDPRAQGSAAARMMSRPHSPFKRSSRPPSRSSPSRSPSRSARQDRTSDEMSPGAYFAGSSGQAGSSAGPGGHAGAAVGTSYSTSLSRAEHYDVVLEAETGEQGEIGECSHLS